MNNDVNNTNLNPLEPNSNMDNNLNVTQSIGDVNPIPNQMVDNSVQSVPLPNEPMPEVNNPIEPDPNIVPPLNNFNEINPGVSEPTNLMNNLQNTQVIAPINPNQQIPQPTNLNNIDTNSNNNQPVKQKSSLLTILILVFLLIVIVFGGYILYQKFISNNSSNNNSNNNPVVDTEKEETFDYNAIEVEEGFTEVTLTNEDKVKIYNEITNHLDPTSEMGFIGQKLLNGNLQKGEDIFKDDCNKVDFTFWYVTLNNKKEYDISKDIIQDEEYDYIRNLKYAKVMEIAKEMFNVNSINCSKDEYLTIPDGGGGALDVATQIIKKYQNGNTYYTILYFTDNSSCIQTFINNNYDYQECINLNDKLTYNNISKFMKLKYGIKDNGDKYLISLETLN